MGYILLDLIPVLDLCLHWQVLGQILGVLCFSGTGFGPLGFCGLWVFLGFGFSGGFGFEVFGLDVMRIPAT